MLSNFHAAMYYGGGAVVAAQDAPAEPEALLTNSNVEDGDFHYADLPFGERISVVNVSFNDPEDNYRLGIEQVIDNSLIAKYGYKKKDVVAMHCTSRGQAHRFGRLLLFEQEHESDTMTCRTGLDMTLLRPGEIVQAADRWVAAVRTGARLVSYDASTNRLLLDDMSSLAAAASADWTASVVLADGTVSRTSVTESRPGDNTVVIADALDPPPLPGAVAVLEQANVNARLWRVIAIQELGEDQPGYELTAKAYHPDKYLSVESDVNVVTPSYRLHFFFCATWSSR